MSGLTHWTQGNDVLLNITRYIDPPCHHGLARVFADQSAENVYVFGVPGSREALRVRAASHTATVLPSITTGATQDEKVGGTKLFQCAYLASHKNV